MDLFNGLRRRSPNPNSPHSSSSSPSLTQPPSTHSTNNTHLSPLSIPTPPDLSPNPVGYADLTERYHRPSPRLSHSQSYCASTIRIVPSPSHAYPEIHSYPPFSPVSTIAGPTSLPPTSPPPPPLARRTNTAPIRFAQNYLDRPVPPLPLNLFRRERDQDTTPSLSPSLASVHSAETNETTTSSVPSKLPTPRQSDLPRLLNLRNPFRALSISRNWSRDTNPYILDDSSTDLPAYHPPLPKYTSSANLPRVVCKPSNVVEKSQSDSGASVASTSSSASTASGVSNLTDKFPLAVLEKKPQWSGYKWALLFSVIMELTYSVTGSIWAVVLLSRSEDGSQVILASDPDLVIYLSLACVLLILAGFIGLFGTLLNSRPILAFYNLLLWPCLLSICLVGYPSYKRNNLNLSGKLNQAWSQYLSQSDRLTIQGYLMCCGYYSPLHEAVLSGMCYPRTNLPGCKASWMGFEASSLTAFYTIAFSIVPFHILAIIIALLCSNHVDGTFGSGMTPPAYRLKPGDVRQRALAVLSAVTTRTPTIRRVEKGYSWSEKDAFTQLPHSRLRRGPPHWTEVINEPGPDGRALREARERGLL